MNLNQLYYFKKLAELQHYTKAAKELHISQPSLSFAISSLEEELDTNLFQKNGYQIFLTKNGQEFLKYANSSLQELEKGIQTIKKNTNIQTGQIDIAYIPTIAGNFIPKLIKEYLNTFNYQTRFSFYSGHTSEVIKGMKSGKFDVGFCSYVEDEPDLAFFPILTQELVIIVPPDHELTEERKITLKKAAEYPLVTYNLSYNAIGIILMNVFTIEKIQPNIAYEVNDETSIGGFVSEGFGVGIIANLPLLDQFNLKIIPLDINLDTRTVYCVYNKKHCYTKSILSYIEFVKEKQIDLTKGRW